MPAELHDSTRRDPAHPSPVWVKWLVTIFVWGVIVALFFRFFSAFRLLLLGVLAASCLAATMRPLMRFVPIHRRWAQAVLVGITPIVVAAGLVFLLGWLLAGPVKEQVRQLPQLQQNVDQVLQDWSQRLGLDQPITAEQVGDQLRRFLSGQGDGVYSATASFVTGFLVAILFVFFGCIYLLGERQGRLLRPVYDALPPVRRAQLDGALNDLEPRLRWWLIGTLISMTVTGTLSAAGFWIIGLELAIPLAILAGLSEIVPTVGPASAFLVAVLFAATQGTGALLGVVVLWAIVQLLESYVLLPYIMREAVRIPPVVTLFSVAFWGTLFGPPGLLLALPLDLLIFSIADHFIVRREEYQARFGPASGD